MPAVATRKHTLGSHLGESALKVLAFVDSLSNRLGYPPTYREVGEAAGMTYTSVQHHVSVLVGLGLMTREPHQPRTLLITAQGRKYLA